MRESQGEKERERKVRERRERERATKGESDRDKGIEAQTEGEEVKKREGERGSTRVRKGGTVRLASYPRTHDHGACTTTPTTQALVARRHPR